MEDIIGHWVFQFLGRLHPLVVHFPIGLLVVALFMEFLTVGGKRKGLREGIHWMVYIGGALAIVSAILGWLLRTQDDYTGELVQDHQNLGIATAFLAGITVIVLLNTLSGKLSNFIFYRSSLLITVLLLTLTGHLGANLTHGEDYFGEVLRGNKDVYDSGKASELLARLQSVDSLSELQLDSLNLEVRAIMAHNCYQCHSENKHKGELILDNKRGVFKGGDSGSILVSGKPEESEMYKRISLSPNEDGVMPKKGKVLKDDEIELIKLWIKKGAHWSDRALKVFPEAELALSKPSLPESSTESHPVDQLVGAYFESHNENWTEVVDDRTFVRRVYLDIIGLLPKPEQIAAFILDQQPNKREVLIDGLLANNHGYTQHWLSFWNDLLRNDYSGTGFITGGRKQITGWLYKALEENKPYHVMIKELVNPVDGSEGFIKGIQWRGVVNASQRTEMQAAQNIGQSLMGMNVKCASCHNSFVSNLTLEQSYGFASIFADSLLELNRCDKPIGKIAQTNFLYPELGSVDAETLEDRLALLAEVMVKPENGRIYRTLTNRIWKRLMGRGIVEPVDEMDNSPWDSSLLDWLAADFIESGYNLKHLIKQILSSKAYQLPTAGYKKQEDLKAKYVFKGPVPRRMTAEQFSDAVSQIIAPMYHSVAYDPIDKGLNTRRIWHREMKFDRDVLPNPGKRYFRRHLILPNTEIEMAKVLISVDHSYTLYINGKRVSEGVDWRKVDKLNVKKMLSVGHNVIAIEGMNEGSIANPAGILFALQIDFKDGQQNIINSDKLWKSTAETPKDEWAQLDFDDTSWNVVRDYGSAHWGKLVDFVFGDEGRKFARASLVKQHPFMKAMGRPSRENVATTRDDQATLLQALELTNGTYFNNVLEEGASQWLDKYGAENEKIVETLYSRSFGRKPSPQERKVMLAALGDVPQKEALQDLFWSTLILPEFQFIY
ncbi:DUF1549 domain-containing protein [Maribacter sp. HTCC2170]|uniref:DUF1549 domain-containing protein n=1 Tax=Maribacter sp. (strain HTCC2170 / KCCM 42371) TaxID=313603 RepID=UPI00006BD3C8|nr:DUF1549 domain-containing protein [Maribacter sp. HTCC2170]EAR02420.1 hypothetical protein FB2170_04015 [Maribacter sp. HTCC2170]